MRFNAHKENIFFEKNKKTNNLMFSQIKPKNVIEDIEKIYNQKEDVYFFESGDKANFLYERSCVNDLSFNYFQIYNESVYTCLKEIKTVLEKLLEKNKISKKRNLYYIASEYETDFLENFWYDTGGINITNFSGYWFLETKDNAEIKINNSSHPVSEGSLAIFQSGSRLEFLNVCKAISFNLTTINKLAGQYPQKWMPV